MSTSALRFVLASALALAPAVLFGAEEGHGGEEPQLLVPPNVWAILSFFLVAAIVVKKILPRIVEVMDRRAETIRASLEAAERARAEREALLASHAAEVQRCRDEALRIVQEGKADAERLRERVVADARREAEELSAKARREIELAKQAAVDELQRRAVDLAFDLAGRLIRKNLDPKDHEDLVRERIRSLPPS